MKNYFLDTTQKVHHISSREVGILFLVIVLIINFLLFGIRFPQPVQATDLPATPSPSSDTLWPTGPEVNAQAAIVMEANTGLILYSKDIYSSYYPASITKIMTSLLAFENCSMNEIMTMTVDAEMNVYGSRVGLVRGESVTMESAMYAVLLESANEVTYGVAEHVGGTMPAFVEMMNARAQALGCVNTHFVNPHGLHEEGHYVCAYDMALISRAAIAIPEFRKIAGTRTYTIPATNKNVARPMAHHHNMIRKTYKYDYAIAGKTGATNEALNTLVTFAEKDGLLLICVVLRVDTTDHMYEDTVKLCNFGFENFKAHNIKENELGEDAAFASLFSTATPFSVTANESILSIDSESMITLPNTVSFDDVTKSVEFSPLTEFYHGNNTIGTINYYYGGVFVGSANIIYYNEGFPINATVFQERWPSFLFTPDEVVTDTHRQFLATHLPEEAFITPTEAPIVTPPEEAPSSFLSAIPRKGLIIGGAVAIILLLLAIYLFAFELPYRRKHA